MLNKTRSGVAYSIKKKHTLYCNLTQIKLNFIKSRLKISDELDVCLIQRNQDLGSNKEMARLRQK